MSNKEEIMAQVAQLREKLAHASAEEQVAINKQLQKIYKALASRLQGSET